MSGRWSRTYQAIVPRAIRGPLYELRRAAWIIATDPVRRREYFASGWVALGQPKRRVRVAHGSLTVDLRDRGVGRKIYVYRDYEADEAAVMRGALKPGMTYLDIGGNIGYLATLAARLVGRTGQVIAIEPEPYNFSLLCRNLKANPYAHAYPVNVAAGSQPGVARLFKDGRNLGDHRLYTDADSAGRASVEVPVVRLDDLFAARDWPTPDFIKIDVQGYEPFAVAGLDGLMAKGRPMTVMTEYWPIGMRNAGGDPDAYRRWFTERGFACYRIGPAGEFVPTDPAAIDDHLPSFDPAHPDCQMLNLVFRR